MEKYKILLSALIKEKPFSWPVLLIKSYSDSNKIYKKTSWGKGEKPQDECTYVQQFSLAAALYKNLTKSNSKEQAYNLVENAILQIALKKLINIKNQAKIEKLQGLEKLDNFLKFNENNDISKHNLKEISKEKNKIEVKITKCVVNEFFKETGTPELTRIICKVDEIFYPQEFSDVDFNRGDNVKNTIAYGKEKCTFIWKNK